MTQSQNIKRPKVKGKVRVLQTYQKSYKALCRIILSREPMGLFKATNYHRSKLMNRDKQKLDIIYWALMALGHNIMQEVFLCSHKIKLKKSLQYIQHFKHQFANNEIYWGPNEFGPQHQGEGEGLFRATRNLRNP